MLTESVVLQIAHQWLDDWNRHDLDAIMSHYADGIEFTSPMIVKLLGDRTGTIKGKSPLRAYFAKGLATYPQLNFTLLQVLFSVDSFIIYYRSIHDLVAAEVTFIDQKGLITKVIAHYS